MSQFWLFPLPILFLGLCFVTAAFAERVHIFDVRRNLPMSSKDVVYKDYYLSGGRDVGLRENMVLTVYRISPLHDHARNEARGNMRLRVGQLKILAAGEKNAIARAYKSSDPKQAPVLDVEAFQMGDVVELTEAFVEKVVEAASPSSPEAPRAPAAAATKTPVVIATVELAAGSSEAPPQAPVAAAAPN